MNTPWGNAQQVEQYTRGFSNVSTASHGGFMIGKGFAEKHLSKSAIKRGMKYCNYLAYEEDCDWAIPAWELKEYRNVIFQHFSNIKDDPEKILLRILSAWNDDYLLEIGVKPLEEQYEHYKQLRKQLYNEDIQ